MHVLRCHELRQVGEQQASDAAHGAGDDESRELIAEGGKANCLHTSIIDVTTTERHAKARIDQAMTEKRTQDQRGQDEIVEHRILVQVEGLAKLAAIGVDAVVTAVFLHADTEKKQHLRKRQSDHDEIHTAGSQADDADQ